jgi:transcriptional regulator with XRE-family HTH domain
MSPNNETVTTTEALRELIRVARGRAGLKQKEAAKRARISTSWWRHVESAWEENVSLDVLLKMLDTVAILPQDLMTLTDEHGVRTWAGLAKALSERHAAAATRLGGTMLEQHLWAAPASPSVRAALVAYARLLNETLVVEPDRIDPFADSFQATRREVSPNQPGDNEQGTAYHATV